MATSLDQGLRKLRAKGICQKRPCQEQFYEILCSVRDRPVTYRESMTSDAELLQSYVSDRSNKAFAELVRRHLDGVYSAALRRVGGDSHLAQDVSQHVFIAL